MQKASEYKEKQVLSLTDKIKHLQETEKTMRLEQAEWNAGKKQREEALAGIDAQAFAANKAHEATIKVHDEEIEQKKGEISRLIEIKSKEDESYSHAAAEHSVALIGHDELIKSRKTTVDELIVQEGELRKTVSRLSSDKVLAMKDTAKSLDDARRALAQVTEIVTEISTLTGTRDKLLEDIKRIEKTRHVLVEDVLTERGKLLLENFERRTKMSQALDAQITVKKKALKP